MNGILDQAALDAFAEHAEIKFEKLATNNALDKYGIYKDCYDKDSIQKFVHKGIIRARSHGLASEGEISDYITLMQVFGYDFDTDPHHQWTHEFINSDESTYMFGKTIHAIELGARYQKRISLDPSELLQRLEKIRNDYKACNLSNDHIVTPEHLENTIKSFWPENDLVILEHIPKKLHEAALPIMTQHHITSFCGQISWVILSAYYGYGFHHDPVYPDIMNALNNEQTESEKINNILSAFIEKTQCHMKAGQST